MSKAPKSRKTAATIEDSLKTFTDGALTLEEWHRQQVTRRDIHVVVRQTNAPGVVA